jgi:hypothetical protein
METQYKEFVKIFYKYFSVLPARHCSELDDWCDIYQNLKAKRYDFIKDIKKREIFINMTEQIPSMIFHRNKYDKNDTVDFDENNSYSFDAELNCCYKIKLYLNSIK